MKHYYFAVRDNILCIKFGAFYVCGKHNHYINNKARAICRKFNLNWGKIEITPISEEYYIENYWWLNANK